MSMHHIWESARAQFILQRVTESTSTAPDAVKRKANELLWFHFSADEAVQDHIARLLAVIGDDNLTAPRRLTALDRLDRLLTIAGPGEAVRTTSARDMRNDPDTGEGGPPVNDPGTRPPR